MFYKPALGHRPQCKSCSIKLFSLSRMEKRRRERKKKNPRTSLS